MQADYSKAKKAKDYKAQRDDYIRIMLQDMSAYDVISFFDAAKKAASLGPKDQLMPLERQALDRVHSVMSAKQRGVI